MLLERSRYRIILLYFHRCKKDMTSEEKKEEISLSKEHCYRSAFLVMFITFPEASSRILRMLPPACQQICQVWEPRDYYDTSESRDQHTSNVVLKVVDAY